MARQPWLLGVVIVLASMDAAAYVRLTTSDGVPLIWPARRVQITVDARGSDDVGPSATLEQARLALSNWVIATADCTDLGSKFEIVSSTNVQIGSADRVHVVLWQGSAWPYGALNPAWKVVTFVDVPTRPDHAQIVDVDIELNGVDFAWGIATGSPGGPDVMDVQATLTAAFGTLLGLDVNCYRGSGPHATDHRGVPVPDCISATQEVEDATMYPFIVPNEIKKRSPEPDDVAGICAVHPPSSIPQDEAGCACGTGRPDGSLGAGLAVLLVARCRRRRHRSHVPRGLG